MMSTRTWKLNLTLPDEPALTRVVSQAELADAIRSVMSGEVPARAELGVTELPRDERAPVPLAEAA